MSTQIIRAPSGPTVNLCRTLRSFDTALEPLDAAQHDHAVARAMVDLNTWDALRDQGIGPADSVSVIAGMLVRRFASEPSPP